MITLIRFSYLLSSSCETDSCATLSNLRLRGVGGVDPSMMRRWLSASSRLISWLGVETWS